MTDELVTTPEAAPSATFAGIGSETAHEFVRYFVASAIALAVDVGMLWLLTSVLGVPYLISAAISFALGIVIIYLLSIRWVFDARRMRSAQVEFAAFLAIGIVGLIINEAILYVLTGVFGFFYLASKLASVFVVFTWNFTARKMMLFSKKA